MNMQRALTGSWSGSLSVIAGIVDLDASVREYKAFQRPREIRSADDLLRLALAYGAGLGSYRTLSAWALAVGLGNLSDVALLKRLRGASDWLLFLAGRLLASLYVSKYQIELDRPIRIIDASCISRPGSKGTDFRLHGVYDPRQNAFTQLELTDAKGGERLSRFSVKKNEIWLADRGYIAVHGLSHVTKGGGDFVIRVGWNAMRLFHPGGERFDLLDALRKVGKRLDIILEAEDRKNGGIRVPVRLIAMRKSTEHAAKERRRIRQEAKRKGKTPTAQTLEAADWIVLVTSLDREAYATDWIFALYRIRWQIEIGFKRMPRLTVRPPSGVSTQSSAIS